jgi:UDP-glucose 6-dehydrogenase
LLLNGLILDHPDFQVVKKLMKGNVIFDGRNIYDIAEMKN